MLAGSMAGYFLLPDYGYFGHLAGVAAEHLKRAWREVQRNKTIDVPYTTDTEVPELPGYSKAVSESTPAVTMPENSPPSSDWTTSEASDWTTTTSEIANPDSISAKDFSITTSSSPETTFSSPETTSSNPDWNDDTRARGRAQLREQQIRIRNDI